MAEKIWTGPALSNPRNRRRMTFVTFLGDQDASLADALAAGRLPAPSTGVTIRGRAGVTLVGDIEISDFSLAPLAGTVRFHLWERQTESQNGWRVCHEVSASTRTGLIYVTPIDVAPDDPGVAFPSSPA